MSDRRVPRIRRNKALTSWSVRLIFLVWVILLAGCNSSPIAHDLSQSQATQIVALLNQKGIGAQASKESGSRGRFTVTVKKDKYAQAVALINEKGLPAEPELSFAELVAPQGLLPSSREVEALRLDHAMAAEVEELLQSHPAIASARVVIRMSVVAQERRGHKIDSQEVVQLVLRSVPGIKPENVYVAAHPIAQDEQVDLSHGVYNENGTVIRVPLVPFLSIWRVPEDEYNTLAIALIFCFLVVGVIGGVFGYWYAFGYSNRQHADNDMPEIRQRVLKVERIRRDLPEN
jgi:type III secretory pathway lipoprotein EscJ